MGIVRGSEEEVPTARQTRLPFMVSQSRAETLSAGGQVHWMLLLAGLAPGGTGAGGASEGEGLVCWWTTVLGRQQ